MESERFQLFLAFIFCLLLMNSLCFVHDHHALMQNSHGEVLERLYTMTNEKYSNRNETIDHNDAILQHEGYLAILNAHLLRMSLQRDQRSMKYLATFARFIKCLLACRCPFIRVTILVMLFFPLFNIFITIIYISHLRNIHRTRISQLRFVIKEITDAQRIMTTQEIMPTILIISETRDLQLELQPISSASTELLIPLKLSQDHLQVIRNQETQSSESRSELWHPMPPPRRKRQQLIRNEQKNLVSDEVNSSNDVSYKDLKYRLNQVLADLCKPLLDDDTGTAEKSTCWSNSKPEAYEFNLQMSNFNREAKKPTAFRMKRRSVLRMVLKSLRKTFQSKLLVEKTFVSYNDGSNCVLSKDGSSLIYSNKSKSKRFGFGLLRSLFKRQKDCIQDQQRFY